MARKVQIFLSLRVLPRYMFSCPKDVSIYYTINTPFSAVSVVCENAEGVLHSELLQSAQTL